MDVYEEKLFQMFKSHDVTNSGLDETSLIKLCNSLELSDKSNIIVESLINKKDENCRIDFKSFKEALLNFLGTQMEANQENDKALKFSDDENKKIENIRKCSGSPGREVSPKLIMGTKKYGRKSKPQPIATDSSSASETDEDILSGVKSNRVHRSASQTDVQNTNGHRNRRRPANATNAKLKRCTSLPAQKRNFHAKTYSKEQQQQQQLQIQQIKHQQLSGQLDSKEQKQLASSVESLDLPISLEVVPVHSVIEMWENAGVNDAKNLLLNLGFEDDDVDGNQLMKVLEEELRGLQHTETQITLLKALISLEKAEIAILQQSFKQLCEENKKLHADNRDANKRAALLAQEIDERHANLEHSTKKEIRLIEQRHAEIVRELTSQMTADRENWSQLNVKFESRIKSLEQEEQRLKQKMQILQEENCALETDQTSLQKQITDLLETNIKLNNEIMALTEKNSYDPDGLKEESDEVVELIEKIATLQVENKNLRDKNDEITTELEYLNMELIRVKMSNKKLSKSPIVLSDSATETLSDDGTEHASSLAMKRRGDSPSKAKLSEESPRTGKLRKCSNDGTSNSESEGASGDWISLNSELNINTVIRQPLTPSTSGISQDFSSINTAITDTLKDEEIKNLKEKITKLEGELNETKKTHDNDPIPNKEEVEKLKSEKETAESRCRDLEDSLEQMQKAYEECEDYWQNKLAEERQIFEKERQLYEDEQNESDKKFIELMEKVREYEEQFSKDGRLSPIEERDMLEHQYLDLENEMEELRQKARLILDEKIQEIENLKMNIQELKLRLGESVDITQVCMENIEMINEKQHHSEIIESPASSPISYLWNQSTIQAPARDYQNPNWNKKSSVEVCRPEQTLTTSETSIFSLPFSSNGESQTNISNADENSEQATVNNYDEKQLLNTVIQKPNNSNEKIQISSNSSLKSGSQINKDTDDLSSVSSKKSCETSTSISTSNQKSSNIEISDSSNASGLKEKLKRLKFFEVHLREQINDLTLNRDSLLMELQQLQEAKPVLEKAQNRTAGNQSLIQKIQMLEQKNRQLEQQLKQQQQYTDMILQQTWQQQRQEVAELRSHIETQNIIIAEQVQRLTNSDILLKELYIENSRLNATIQQLEAQRTRTNILQQQKQAASFGRLSGMP